MKLFFPFLVAGIILMALLSAQVLHPSLFEAGQDGARAPSLFSLSGGRTEAGRASLAGTRGVRLEDLPKDGPRTSLEASVKDVMAEDRTAGEPSQPSDSPAAREGGITP
jgi:hypothetical protein